MERLALRQTLTKKEILRGRSKFQEIFTHGKPVDGKFLKCLVLRDASRRPPGVLFGVAVPRAVRTAVQRNRIKRLIRESYRLNKSLIAGEQLSLVFLWRSTKNSTMPSFFEIENDMKALLKRIGGVSA